MISMPCYHVASWKRRLPIERYGLKARQTQENNYPSIENQPEGVFAARFSASSLFRHGPYDLGHDYAHDYRDLWRIDALGLPTMNDPVLGREFVVILCDVYPDRIERVAHWDAQEEFWPLPSEMLEPDEIPPPPPHPSDPPIPGFVKWRIERRQPARWDNLLAVANAFDVPPELIG